MKNKLTTFIYGLDEKKLWISGLLLELLVFMPYMILGEKSVFPWHDQLDENILNFILTAKHAGEGLSIFPEMMCGVNASALQPYAILFLPLYMIFSSFVAFVVQYAVIFAMAFFGMYACVKETTNSSILAMMAAGLFSMLPFFPVYGAAVAGVPMCAYGIICLAKRKRRILSFICLTLFATTAHLVFSGYAVLGFWALWIGISTLNRIGDRKKEGQDGNEREEVKDSKDSKDSKIGNTGIKSTIINGWELAGFFYLIVTYILVNYQLFAELLFKTEDFVSHRSEFVSASTGFWDAFISLFESSSQHAESYHEYLILPIVLLLGLGVLRFGHLTKDARIRLCQALVLFLSIVLVALFYAFCKCPVFVNWKNQNDGILHYFQIERFYWLYPFMWYMELALAVSVWWRHEERHKGWFSLQVLLLGVMVLPTALLILSKSNFYMVSYEMVYGHDQTGYIPWEDYYAEDLMSRIETDITSKYGEKIDSYRVVHLGLNPTPALVHGFFTVDGYSNNYPLEYKHDFRQVMEKELEKAPDVAAYYDDWGNRCYLFNSQSGTSFINGKRCGIAYEGLEIDWNRLRRDYDCEFIFSCGPIYDAKEQNLEEVGYYVTDTSFWGFFVYRIKDAL